MNRILGYDTTTAMEKHIGHLRNVPAEARAVWLEGVTETELSQMCDEIDAVIYALTTMSMANLPEQAKREQYLREAKAIEDALDLEEMRRLVTKVQRKVEGEAMS